MAPLTPSTLSGPPSRCSPQDRNCRRAEEVDATSPAPISSGSPTLKQQENATSSSEVTEAPSSLSVWQSLDVTNQVPQLTSSTVVAVSETAAVPTPSPNSPEITLETVPPVETSTTVISTNASGVEVATGLPPPSSALSKPTFGGKPSGPARPTVSQETTAPPRSTETLTTKSASTPPAPSSTGSAGGGISPIVSEIPDNLPSFLPTKRPASLTAAPSSSAVISEVISPTTSANSPLPTLSPILLPPGDAGNSIISSSLNPTPTPTLTFAGPQAPVLTFSTTPASSTISTASPEDTPIPISRLPEAPQGLQGQKPGAAVEISNLPTSPGATGFTQSSGIPATAQALSDTSAPESQNGAGVGSIPRSVTSTFVSTFTSAVPIRTTRDDDGQLQTSFSASTGTTVVVTVVPNPSISAASSLGSDVNKGVIGGAVGTVLLLLAMTIFGCIFLRRRRYTREMEIHERLFESPRQSGALSAAYPDNVMPAIDQVYLHSQAGHAGLSELDGAPQEMLEQNSIFGFSANMSALARNTGALHTGAFMAPARDPFFDPETPPQSFTTKGISPTPTALLPTSKPFGAGSSEVDPFADPLVQPLDPNDEDPFEDHTIPTKYLKLENRKSAGQLSMTSSESHWTSSNCGYAM